MGESHQPPPPDCVEYVLVSKAGCQVVLSSNTASVRKTAPLLKRGNHCCLILQYSHAVMYILTVIGHCNCSSFWCRLFWLLRDPFLMRLQCMMRDKTCSPHSMQKCIYSLAKVSFIHFSCTLVEK